MADGSSAQPPPAWSASTLAAAPGFPGVRDGGLPRATRALMQALAPEGWVPATVDSEDAPINTVAASLAAVAGLTPESATFHEPEIESLLRSGHPFLFVPFPGERRVLAVRRGRKPDSVIFVGEDGEREVSRSEARRILSSAGAERLQRMVERIGASARTKQAKVLEVLTQEIGGSAPLGWGLVFRSAPPSSIPAVLKSLGIGRYLGRLLALSTTQSILTTLGWAVIGSLGISGQAARGSLAGWALLSITATLIQLGTTRYVGRFTIRAATLLRQHLVEGALRMDPEELGSFGFGGLMVVASQADVFLNAVIALFLALLGVLTNIAAAAAVLYVAPLSGVTLSTFGVFLVAILATLPIFAVRTATQQDDRLRLTTDMVERMLGHRTRLVQQSASAWHDGEDESVAGYAARSRKLDRSTILLRALPRFYYCLSVGSLFLVLVTHPTQEALALSIGGMTLGMAGLTSAVELVLAAAALHALWTAIRPVARSKETLRVLGDKDASVKRGAESERPLLELKGVSFSYPRRATPILEDARLAIRPNDRILVEGRSGGGKTTLAALLTGLRKPDHGLMLVQGLDQFTVSEHDLRRTVAAAPQFYKNHVFSQTLGYNVLLGRGWPPAAGDLKEAVTVLRELGLGPLLAKMPAGVFQHVGEMGWQLSHGEKSRVYLARALLQRSELVVLDESFGALDPDTLRQCMDTVFRRAKTIVTITHR